MSIRDWLYHRHYWGVPHRREGRVIQICYECGKEREVSIDLVSKESPDQRRIDEKLNSDEIEMRRETDALDPHPA